MAAPRETQTAPEAFKLEQFGGQIPAWDDHLIPAGQAASAIDTYLFSGGLQGWRVPKLLYTFKNSAAQFAYRVPARTENIAWSALYFLTNPNVGDKVTLGEEVYTFVQPLLTSGDLKSPPYSVLIGAIPYDTMINTLCAFVFDNGMGTNAGVLYSTGTVANPAIDQTRPQSKNGSGVAPGVPGIISVQAPSSGAAYNITVVGESDAGGAPTGRLSWQGDNGTATTFTGGTNVTYDPSITSSSVWLEFLDPDTDVVRSPVVDDQFGRYYFASPSLPPRYTTLDTIMTGPTTPPPWLLGVPAPGCTPGVSVAGGGDTAQIGFPASTSTAQGAPGANTIYLIPVTPTGAMSLLDVSFMPNSTNNLVKMAAVVYNDDNGTPGTLLNTGVVVQGVTVDVPVASAFTNPSGLLMNVQYWIGFMTDKSVSVQQADDTGALGVVALNTFSNGPPAVINNLSTGYPNLQVWGECRASSVLEARSYVFTYVSAYNEEGPPSPPTVVTGWSNGTWTIELTQPPPDQLGVPGGRYLSTINLYRTITGIGGDTTYFFVASMPIQQSTYIDVITDDLVALNLQLTSQLYTPPPEDLQGLTTMPNGMMVGFRSNELWFCQPYLPHAWPPSYVLTTEYPIIGLGVSGTTVVAATLGAPYIASGVSPGTMTASQTPVSEPCIARGSVLGNNDGVYYASPNGLILVTPYGAVTNTTEIWITREKWQQLTPQEHTRAIFFVSAYFALGCARGGDASVAQQGYTIELNNADATSFSIWPQPGGHRLGFSQLTGPNDQDTYNLRIDPWSGVCLVFYHGAVCYYDFTDPAPTMHVYTWRSKLYQQKSRKNLAAMQVTFSVPPGTPAQNPTPNTAPADDPSWNTLQTGQYGIIRVFAGGKLRTCREIRKTNENMRILDGFKSGTWQIEITARVLISNIQIGSSTKALANI